MAPKKKEKQDQSNLKQESVLEAVVIADSFNKRFYPVTADRPRCLFPLANRPLISYTLEFLASCDVKKIYIYCCHAADQIKDYLQNSKWTKSSSVSKVSVISSSDFTSVGDVLRDVDQKSLFETDFLLVRGDIVSNMQLRTALKEHKTRREKDKNVPLMTLVMCKSSPSHSIRSNEDDVVIATDADSQRILHYQKITSKKRVNFPMSIFESSKCKVEIRYDLVDSGIWVCAPQVPPLFTDNFDYQSQQDFIKGILINEEFLGNQIHMHVMDSQYCSRVHNLHTYDVVSRNVVSRWTYPFVPDYCYDNLDEVGDKADGYSLMRHNVYLHHNCTLKHNAVVKDRSIIGQNTVIGSRCLITNSVIGNNCIIEDDCNIDGCYVWNDVTVKSKSRIKKSVLCDKTTVLENVEITEGCVLCDQVVVGPSVKIPTGTTLYLSSNFNEKEGSFSVEDVGANGRGYIYKAESEDNQDELVKSLWGMSLEDHKKQVEDNLDFDEDSESGSDDGSSLAEEIDAEEQEIQIDDDLSTFQQEVKESLVGAIDEKILCDNLVLEINSSKYAYNMTIKDVVQTVVRSVLEIATQRGSSNKEYFAGLKPMLVYLCPLLCKYTTTSSSQLDCIFALEEYALLHEHAADSLIKVLMLLYEKDIICEEVIMHWNKNPRQFVGSITPRQIREKVAKFIQWLLEAEEEESSSDEY